MRSASPPNPRSSAFTLSSDEVPPGGLRVLLVKPPNLSDHIQPPLGLGFLATAVRDRHQVALLDCLHAGITSGRFTEVLERFRPDVVGFQMYTYDLAVVRDLLRRCRAHRPDIVTVAGGPHPSCDPVGTLDQLKPDLDFLFVGEAEVGFPRLLDRLTRPDGAALGEIPGLGYRENGKSKSNAAHIHADLDELGFPAWDMIRPETYPEAQHGAFFDRFPIAPLLVTRGCPYRCTFCSAHLIAGRRVRRRSVAHVMEEILALYHGRGIREFHIVDDNFTMNVDFAKEVLRELKSHNLDISWATPNGVRLDRLDRELLTLMRDTGLYMISAGVESGSDRILKQMSKGNTTASIEKSLRLIADVGIPAAGFFVIGFPDETEAEVRRTIDFALRLPLQRANFFTFLPFPGTEAYRALRDSGELGDADWSDYVFMKLPYSPATIPRKRLRNLQRWAFLRFHARPRILGFNLRRIRSVRHFKYLLKRVYHWIIAD